MPRSTGHDFQTSDTCSANAKLLNLWSFEWHRSHAKRDRKRAPHMSQQASSSACHIAYAACSQHACAGCSMCVYADFRSAMSPISPSLRSSCPRCSKSMGERHWAHAWAQALVGVLQSSRHLGCHCRVQHQQPPTVANSVHHAHSHLDSTPSKGGEGYRDGIPGVAGGATEPTQTPRRPFSEVMVKTTFDLLTSFDKDARRRLAMSSSLRRHLSWLSSD